MDANGYIYDLVSTIDELPDVDTGADGVNDAHAFSLTNLPSSRLFRLYLIEQGRVTSMYGDTGVFQGNVFSLSPGANVQLGQAFTGFYSASRGAFQNNLLQQPGMNPHLEDPAVPRGIEQPPVLGLTDAQLTERGRRALQVGWFGGAAHYLEQVADNTALEESNDADTARFMLALARVGLALTDLPSDNRPQQVDRLGDVMDILGLPDDTNRGSYLWIDYPGSLDQSLFSGEQASDFLEERFLQSLD